MLSHITHRKATINDLNTIINLLIEDELGKTRENTDSESNPRYFEAFQRIEADPNQYLMVVEHEREIIGTCHLTLMPSLTAKFSRHCLENLA